MWLYLAIQAGAIGSRVIPLRLRYRMSTVIADFLWLIWTSKRRTCIDNMSVVLGGLPTDKSIRRVARLSFHQFGKATVDFLGFSNFDPQDPLVANMRLPGWENVDVALARGKGVILATGHFGSTDMGGMAIANRIGPFYAIADQFRPSYVDRLVWKTREQKGFRLIPTNSVREIVRALHANGLVVVLYDRPLPAGQGVPVSFFGRETALPGGPAVIANRTGAAIVPGFIYRNRDNSCWAELFPAINHDVVGDKDRIVRIVTQRLADALETAVRKRPDQWYMFRPMWPGLLQTTAARETREIPAQAV